MSYAALSLNGVVHESDKLADCVIAAQDAIDSGDEVYVRVVGVNRNGDIARHFETYFAGHDGPVE